MHPFEIAPLKEGTINEQMEIHLKEQVGIDRSVLYDFNVVDVNVLKLATVPTGKDTGRYANIVYDEASPVVTSTGRHIGKLLVKDPEFGKLTLSFEKNNLTNLHYVKCKLEMTVTSELANLQNLNAEAYKTHVNSVFDMLEQDYGIKIDHSSVKVKQLEVNATFYLNESYEKYQKPILLLMQNAASKYYHGKHLSWNEADAIAKKTTLETSLVKNSSMELTIYNKGKQLIDDGLIDPQDLTADIMRVEYRIKDRRILRHAFKSEQVDKITDQKLRNLFQKYIERDLVAPYMEWAEQNHNQLVYMVQQHRAAEQKWTASFFRECRQFEATHGFPILFDLEDMRSVFKELENGSGRNAGRKFRKFLNSATYEKDLLGNTKRLQEILTKITAM